MTPKVLFLNPWGQFIGPNRYLLEILRHNSDLAVGAVVVFAEANGASEDYRKLGCQIEIWPEIGLIHPRLTVQSAKKFLLTHSAGLFKIIPRLRSLGPDLVVSNTEILWVGGMASRLVNIPHVQVFHGMLSEYRLHGKPRVWRGYLRFLSMWSKCFVAVSQTLASVIVSGGVPAQKVRVVQNPIPLESLQSESSNQTTLELDTVLKDRYPILVCAGQIFPVKGQDLLVEVLPAIKCRYPGVLCIFAGRLGSEAGLDDTKHFYRQLESRVDELNLRSNVIFLGETEYLNVLFKKSHVSVQPSRMESFCRVVAEALLCGTPVVAFATGAIPEVAGRGALLVPPGDVRGLADAVISTLENPKEAQRRVQEGRVHIEKSFNAVDVAKRFYDVLLQTSRLPRKGSMRETDRDSHSPISSEKVKCSHPQA
jgi:glycosyltransferase involved in cell wall biosynthesis